MSEGKVSRGRRWGWIGGFLGGGCWLLPLAIVLFFQGDVLGGAATLVCTALWLLALRVFLPWRHRQTRLWKLYLASLAPIALGAFVIVWRIYSLVDDVPFYSGLQLLVLLPVFALPLVTMGKNTWSELEPEDAQAMERHAGK